jgi:hypothetical protein
LNDQKLQPLKCKKTKWCIKLFRQLLNFSTRNALIIYNICQNKLDYVNFCLGLIQQLREKYGTIPHPSTARRPPINPSPRSLVEHHFIEKIPATSKKSRPRRRCQVCSASRKRRDTVYWCPDCNVGLCLEDCFKVYHTKLTF